MPPRRLIAIVEGEGEVEAIPLLVNRWLARRRFQAHLACPRAIRAPNNQSLVAPHDAARALGLERFLDLAAGQGADGILVVLDAEDACHQTANTPIPERLGPRLQARAKAHLPHIPVQVVVAHRATEAWFLTMARSLRLPHAARQLGGLPREPKAYSPTDAKQELARFLGQAKYRETVHMKQLSQDLPMTANAGVRSPSLGLLFRRLEALTQAMRLR